ncbi:MAG: protein-L-isoaspartate O-methyltransferase [Methanobacteriota archaeon]|nr:MAG: protein-L-isoaspartate O-methyltransferase [Euryarchaeota archaeon]
MRNTQELVSYLKHSGFIRSDSVESAFLKIDRKLFVPEGYVDYAYADIAIPIKEGVTISAPSVIAETLEMAELREGMRVLEIGTGSGYSTALISLCIGSGEVVSYEIDEDAHNYAKDKIRKARKESKLGNIRLVLGDGKSVDEGLFDVIIVNAAFSEIEGSWKKSLKEGGAVVGPMVTNGIERLTKYKEGEFSYGLPVLYVRLR